jgi:lipopolysaccharide/colanic/teichoic acid biosynthesis glycosyltransferase
MYSSVPPFLARRRRDSSAAFVLPPLSGEPIRRRTRRAAGTHRRSVETIANEPSAWLLAAKRAIDIAGAGVGLAILSPLLIGIAVAIKVTSPGPVLFRQKRHGYHNRRFRIYKFRTMHSALGDAGGTRQTVSGDPRVTPVGRFLRRTSLDELPQLLNVLQGDMSLVGPRPHVPGMLAGGLPYEHLLPYYFQRHSMRPGITGLAQVNGLRGSTHAPASAIERLDYDLRYIQTWSLWLDTTILVRTVVREFLSGSGE